MLNPPPPPALHLKSTIFTQPPLFISQSPSRPRIIPQSIILQSSTYITHFPTNIHVFLSSSPFPLPPSSSSSSQSHPIPSTILPILSILSPPLPLSLSSCHVIMSVSLCLCHLVILLCHCVIHLITD